ncbi:hypothetical protein QR685DRAFT_151015 [Neurospora intermedia]|uniref:Uncharacterized protein n=1 Tax=Neurospora intermedia TaxID=5142 RepID=A0ABR3D0G6_NEUIN
MLRLLFSTARLPPRPPRIFPSRCSVPFITSIQVPFLGHHLTDEAIRRAPVATGTPTRNRVPRQQVPANIKVDQSGFRPSRCPLIV